MTKESSIFRADLEERFAKCKLYIQCDPGLKGLYEAAKQAYLRMMPTVLVSDDGTSKVVFPENPDFDCIQEMIKCRIAEIVDAFGIEQHEMGFKNLGNAKK